MLSQRKFMHVPMRVEILEMVLEKACKDSRKRNL